MNGTKTLLIIIFLTNLQLFEKKIEENMKMAEDRKRPRYLDPTVASKLKARPRPPSFQKPLPIQVPNKFSSQHQHAAGKGLFKLRTLTSKKLRLFYKFD